MQLSTIFIFISSFSLTIAVFFFALFFNVFRFRMSSVRVTRSYPLFENL